MAAAGPYIPYPPEPDDGRVRDLRNTPTEHLWVWMRRLQGHLFLSNDEQQKYAEEVARRLQAGEDATALARVVADRAEIIHYYFDHLDDVLDAIISRFGTRTPRARR